jgi:ubiquinone/menaquinone biosynthesis C-methylase UbiE
MSFDYSSIPAGYYFEAMLGGAKPQQFWHQNKFKEVVAEIPRDARNMLDVGCAAGGLMYIASRLRPELEFVGVDISVDQIAYANKQVAPLCQKVEFFQCEAGTLAFPDQYFDVVSTVELIEHLSLEEIRLLIAEICRVLAPGGVWIITTPNYRSLWPIIEIGLNMFSPVKYNEQHITKFTRYTLTEFLAAEGLIVLHCRSVYVLSPFLAWVSSRIAKTVFSVEKRLKLPGNLLVAVAARPKSCSI